MNKFKGARSVLWADGLATGVAKARAVILYRRGRLSHRRHEYSWHMWARRSQA